MRGYAGEGGLITPEDLDDLASILAAGAQAIPSKTEPAANALALALDAMARRAEQIGDARRPPDAEQPRIPAPDPGLP